MKPNRKVSNILLPNIFSAHRTSLRPSTMLMRALEPAPTSEPKAWMMFISGKVMVRAASSILPSSGLFPRKIRSTILYIEVTTWLATAGSAYCQRSLPMGLVSSSRMSLSIYCLILFFSAIMAL